MDKEEFLSDEYENGEIEAVNALHDEAKCDDHNNDSSAHVAASDIIKEWSDPELRKQVEDKTQREQEVLLEEVEVITDCPSNNDLNAFEQPPEVQDEMNKVDGSVDSGAQVADPEAVQSPIIEEPPSRAQSEGPMSEAEEITVTETVENKDLDVEVENDELLTCPVLFHLKDQDPIALIGDNGILSEAPNYLLTLDRIFGLLRKRIDPKEGLEIVFQITDLDLVINEDNIYSGETRISDLIEVLDVVPNTPNHLDIAVSFQPRFVFGLNSLFEKLHASPPAKKSKR